MIESKELYIPKLRGLSSPRWKSNTPSYDNAERPEYCPPYAKYKTVNYHSPSPKSSMAEIRMGTPYPVQYPDMSFVNPFTTASPNTSFCAHQSPKADSEESNQSRKQQSEEKSPKRTNEQSSTDYTKAATEYFNNSGTCFTQLRSELEQLKSQFNGYCSSIRGIQAEAPPKVQEFKTVNPAPPRNINTKFYKTEVSAPPQQPTNFEVTNTFPENYRRLMWNDSFIQQRLHFLALDNQQLKCMLESERAQNQREKEEHRRQMNLEEQKIHRLMNMLEMSDKYMFEYRSEMEQKFNILQSELQNITCNNCSSGLRQRQEEDLENQFSALKDRITYIELEYSKDIEEYRYQLRACQEQIRRDAIVLAQREKDTTHWKNIAGIKDQGMQNSYQECDQLRQKLVLKDKQIQMLEVAQKQIEATNATLAEMNKNLQQFNLELAETNRQLDESNKQLQTRLQSQQQDNQKLTIQISELKKEIETMQSKFNGDYTTVVNEANRLKAELNNATLQLKKKTESVAELESTVDELNRQARLSKSAGGKVTDPSARRLSVLESHNQQLKQSLHKLQRKLADQKIDAEFEQNFGWQNQKAFMQAQISRLQTHCQYKDQERQHLRRIIEQIKTDNLNLKAQHLQPADYVTPNKGRNLSLSQNARLISSRQVNSAEMHHSYMQESPVVEGGGEIMLQYKLQEFGSQIESLSARLQAEISNSNSLQRTINNLQKQNSSLKSCISQLQEMFHKSLTDLSNAKTNAEKEIKFVERNLEMKVRNAEVQISFLKQVVESLEKKSILFQTNYIKMNNQVQQKLIHKNLVTREEVLQFMARYQITFPPEKLREVVQREVHRIQELEVQNLRLQCELDVMRAELEKRTPPTNNTLFTEEDSERYGAALRSPIRLLDQQE